MEATEIYCVQKAQPVLAEYLRKISIFALNEAMYFAKQNAHL